MLTVTLTNEPMTLKILLMSCGQGMNNTVINFAKIYPCISENGGNFFTYLTCLFDLTIYGHAETLISELYQFIKFVNLVKFPSAGYNQSITQ